VRPFRLMILRGRRRVKRAIALCDVVVVVVLLDVSCWCWVERRRLRLQRAA
jgi:hypothetical protein